MSDPTPEREWGRDRTDSPRGSVRITDPVCPGCGLPVSIKKAVTIDGVPCHPTCTEWVIKPSETVRLV